MEGWLDIKEPVESYDVRALPAADEPAENEPVGFGRNVWVVGRWGELSPDNVSTVEMPRVAVAATYEDQDRSSSRPSYVSETGNVRMRGRWGRQGVAPIDIAIGGLGRATSHE